MGEKIIALMGGGEVEYDLEEAMVPIDEMIDALIAARDVDGATHVADTTNNWRGARYQRTLTVFDLVDENGDDYLG